MDYFAACHAVSSDPNAKVLEASVTAVVLGTVRSVSSQDCKSGLAQIQIKRVASDESTDQEEDEGSSKASNF